jgi:selenocysteine lyase/cysteine desulfurase
MTYNISRRHFMGSMAATGAAVMAAPEVKAFECMPASTNAYRIPSASDWATVREDFPRAARKLWLAASETHPFNVNTLTALENYTQYRTLGPGEGRQSFTQDMRSEAKKIYANLICASEEEIAFCLSTTDGENTVIAGLDLAKKGGNVVIDDLHFSASEYLYTALANSGHIELRVVKNKNWEIDIDDMEKAIDKNTRLVSMALVSNINGYMHDVKAISEIAHANGALVYGDIIQGAGCSLIDVKAMGIDCCANSSYKYMMGDFGLGFLYVSKELQGTVITQTRYGLQQVRNLGNGVFEPRPGAAGLYEGTTTFAYLSGIAVLEGLRYINNLGLKNIRSHAKNLTDRLHTELPKLGFEAMTPLSNPTPTVSFVIPNPDKTNAQLNKSFGERVVSVRNFKRNKANGQSEAVTGMRIGVSVYNNDDDIDQFLHALRS